MKRLLGAWAAAGAAVPIAAKPPSSASLLKISRRAGRAMVSSLLHQARAVASASLLRGRLARRAEPADDQVGDLDVVLVHHQHVAVALDAERGQVKELGGAAGRVDGADRLIADIA